MLIVTGANGTFGRMVVDRLLEYRSASEIGASVRDPDGAQVLRDKGVRVRQADFAEPQTLRAAFEGAGAVLIVSVNSAGEQAVAHHRAAIAAAREAGASRIVYTSQMGARTDSPFAPMVDHARTEAELATCGVRYTALRNGFYASSALWMAQSAIRDGALIAPADGPVAWTTHEDLAEAAAALLAGKHVIDGSTPVLTASAALDFAQIAALFAERDGRPLRREIISDDDYFAHMTSAGVPEQRAKLALGIYRAMRRGDFAATSPQLRELIGREPQTMREVVRRAVAAT